MRTTIAPGPWLRTCALLAAAGAILAVVSGAAHLGTAHRVVAALVAPPLAALLAAAWLAHRRLVPAVLVAAALFAGAAAVPGSRAHDVLAALSLAALASVGVQSFRGEPVPWGSWRDYVTLTKPRIMSLLLITGVCGMIAGARGWPGTGTAIAATVGLALACGGASALNHVLDRDIDPLMGERTKQRPVASGRVPASRALEFGLALSALSFVLLAATVNLLTAVLALVGNLFYVLVYTRWLKRSTPQNIVIGGAAGAVPPLVGWTAATGHLGLGAWILFAIVFVWTPPHFWALALLIKDNYANAKVPMLPVVRGERETTRQIVLYSIVLVGVTLLPWAAGAGLGYVAAALALGAVFVWLAERLRRDATPRRAVVLFHYSLLYLALLFVALALDLAL
ncbi:MAG: protoheme IX farnesyltransferase [Actinobacteria bacterium]|nr:protoheme IX farnesyltransferase [Actinomycetota bacterium]MBV8480677.1 protoheme IX farnesyltransferase [Actinomycetota bacterium]